MPEKIVDQWAEIGQGLARIEQEKLRRYNPPLVFALSDNAGMVAWTIIQSGRLQQTRLWYAGDDAVTEHSFIADVDMQAVMTWLNNQSPRNVAHQATQSFSPSFERSECLGNFRCLYSRLRVLELI